MIELSRWQKAQEAERKFHNEDFETGKAHYAKSYKQYFLWLSINPDLKGMNVIEIGPADFPALGYCANIGANSLIIEPMPSDFLRRFNLPVSTDMAEDAVYNADEVWLFNVLQHVRDPYAIVERAKKQAKVIRFFEPINYGIDDCHPWNLTMEMFRDWFGDCVRHYKGNPQAEAFHTHECAYGIWRADKC